MSKKHELKSKELGTHWTSLFALNTFLRQLTSSLFLITVWVQITDLNILPSVGGCLAYGLFFTMQLLGFFIVKTAMPFKKLKSFAENNV